MEMTSLQITEDESAANATAPRVTLESLESKIASESYAVVDLVLTICVIKMVNGFYVIGESAPASPENFNADLGRKFSREAALREVWKLEGYALREQLYQGAQNFVARDFAAD